MGVAIWMLAMVQQALADTTPPTPAPQAGYIFQHQIPPEAVQPPPLVPRRAPIQPIGPVLVAPPRPRAPADSLIAQADFPAAARAPGAVDRVGLVLDVGADGRPLACRITRSSGDAVLDAATCRLMVARARFTPAIDSNGNPAPASIEQSVAWRPPARR